MVLPLGTAAKKYVSRNAPMEAVTKVSSHSIPMPPEDPGVPQLVVPVASPRPGPGVVFTPAMTFDPAMKPMPLWITTVLPTSESSKGPPVPAVSVNPVASAGSITRSVSEIENWHCSTPEPVSM